MMYVFSFNTISRYLLLFFCRFCRSDQHLIMRRKMELGGRFWLGTTSLTIDKWTMGECGACGWTLEMQQFPKSQPTTKDSQGNWDRCNHKSSHLHVSNMDPELMSFCYVFLSVQEYILQALEREKRIRYF
jgi:hypothetical protein